ncbi:CD276 antigen-like [Xyrichtys novacula]|uniref:CD276 antigen-like n=1 Tax=Xyrichtys novacula TaxID=13765 RepID=A0AAV1ER09_XYRNO|nr:CD276 antigen-like [Xyrichtys novacula]
MVYLQETSTTMKLVPLVCVCVCLCLVTRSGITFADENGPVVVKEDSDVVLPCSLSSQENIESKLFDWKKDGHMEVFMYDGGLIYGKGISGQDKQFEGRVSHFGDELKNGNASIKISKTKVSDSGNYSCIFPRLQPSQMFNIQLVVESVYKDRSGENGAASPKPCIEITEQTLQRALLQCEVQGASPEPKLEWQDSSGKDLPAREILPSKTGDKYQVTLQTTVTKTDHYSCVLKQDGIHHEIKAQTFVYIHGEIPEDSSCKVIIGVLSVLLIGFSALVIFLALFVRYSPTCRDKVIKYLSKLKSADGPL